MTGATLTEASLARLVFKTALPAVATVFLQLTFNVADTFWVGRTLGATALAAVSTAGFYVWMVLALGEMLAVGLTALASRRHGETRPDAAARAVGAAVHLAGWGGLIVAAFTLAIRAPLFALMAVPADAGALGATFLGIYALGIPFVFGSFVIEAAFRASGDTRTPFLLLGTALVLNIVLDPLFILGVGPFPELGIGGAAAATVLTRGIACAVGLALLRARRLIRLRPADWPSAPTILRVGLPAAATGVLFSLVYMLLTRVTARFGTPALAALGVGHKIEGLAYFTGVGFALAAAAIVGQNLGARRPQRAVTAGWVAVGYTSVVTSAMGLVYLVVPEPLVRIFVDDPAVVLAGVAYLRIVALATVAQGVELVLEGALGGAGYTFWPFVWSAGLTALRIPLAVLLAPAWGLLAIWWVLSLTAIARGIAMAALWRFAPWRGRVL